MLKSKYIVALVIASLVFFSAYATTKLSLNIISKTSKELSFEVVGGVKPYQITVAGEKFTMKNFEGNEVKIKSPSLGRYLIVIRDSKGTVDNFEIIIEK